VRRTWSCACSWEDKVVLEVRAAFAVFAMACAWGEMVTVSWGRVGWVAGWGA
jgi:hypothetical protein